MTDQANQRSDTDDETEDHTPGIKRQHVVKRLAGDYDTGIRLSKKEMKPYEARLERSQTLRKYDITIKPRGR